MHTILHLHHYPHQHPFTARNCARLGPPLLFFIWFFIASPFVLVYNLHELEVIPRRFVDVLGIAFAVLVGVWVGCWGGLWFVGRRGAGRVCLVGENVERGKGSVAVGMGMVGVVEWLEFVGEREGGDNRERQEEEEEEQSPAPSFSTGTPPPTLQTSRHLDGDLALNQIPNRKDGLSSNRGLACIFPDPMEGRNELPGDQLPPLKSDHPPYIYNVNFSRNIPEEPVSYIDQQQIKPHIHCSPSATAGLSRNDISIENPPELLDLEASFYRNDFRQFRKPGKDLEEVFYAGDFTLPVRVKEGCDEETGSSGQTPSQDTNTPVGELFPRSNVQEFVEKNQFSSARKDKPELPPSNPDSLVGLSAANHNNPSECYYPDTLPTSGNNVTQSIMPGSNPDDTFGEFLNSNPELLFEHLQQDIKRAHS